MSPIEAFLEGRIREEELFFQVEQVLSGGSAADRTVLLVDWRTKSGRIRTLETRRALDETVRKFSGVLLSDMRRVLSEGVATQASLLERGSLLAGRFVLEEKIGSGGMSEVYKCRDIRREEAQDRNPYVAVKVLLPSLLDRDDSIKILQREARKAQNLAHPNIVRIYDFDRDGEILFITMELLNGSSLEEIIHANGVRGAALPAIIPTLTQMVSALQFAHREGIVHSDLKPSNVIVQPDGRVKIIDFGISRARGDIHQKTTDRTTFDVHALGALTPAYASPEMIEGDPPDPRDDVFALACIVYEWLSGRHPFGRMPAAMARAGNFRPARPDGVSSRQWEALQSGLHFERARRAASPEMLLAGLMPPGAKRPWHRVGLIAAIAVVAVAGGVAAEFVISGRVGSAADWLTGSRPAVLPERGSSGEIGRKQAAERAAEAAAKQQAAQQAAEATAKQQAAQQAAEATAKQQAAQQTIEAAARQQAAQQAAGAAARQQAARKSTEEVTTQQTAQLPDQTIGPEQVAQVQAKLNSLGFDTGRVDGELGPRTREMIRAFQAATGVPQTGDVTEELLHGLQDTNLNKKIRARVLFRMAEAAQSQHRNQEAVRLYRLGLNLNPTNSVASVKLKELLANNEPNTAAAAQTSQPQSRGTGIGNSLDKNSTSKGNSEGIAGAASPCPPAAICLSKGAQESLTRLAPHPWKSPPKGPYDGEYHGTFRAGWLSSGICTPFKSTVIVRDNIIYIKYRYAEITAQIGSNGSFRGSEELHDIHMTETISGKIIGNMINARTNNRLCTYHATLTRYPSS